MSIKAENITKSFGGNMIFENMTIDIHERKRTAIVGRNGCGKTTILQILAGLEQPDHGRVIKKKNAILEYLHQIPPYEDLSAEEVLRLAFAQLASIEQQMRQLEADMQDADKLDRLLHRYGDLQEQFTQLGGYEMDSQLQMVASGLGIQSLLTKPFVQLSGGEKTKVMLGQILLTKPDILLLDEPTNHLDMLAVEWLESYLKSFSGTLVLVSHDRQFMNEVATKIIEIDQGEPHIYHGNYDQFVTEREARLLSEFAQYEEQQKKIAKMKETIKRLKQWANEANPPNDGLHRRAKSMEKALARIELVKKPVESRKMNLTLKVQERSGKDVVAFEQVSKSYDRTLFHNVSFQLRWQERIAIVGANGTGKSTLLKMITGDVAPDSGGCKVGSNVKIGYLSQHIQYSDDSSRLIDVFRELVPVTEAEARHILAKFLFYGYDVFKKVKDLSGGEKMRLRLAQFMYDNINLLVLDEPTNHLDIESREVLEDTLQHFDGTVIAVSHDRYFLNQLFDKTAWLSHGQLVLYEGNYEWAREKHSEWLEKWSQQTSNLQHQKQPQERHESQHLQQQEQPFATKQPHHSDQQHQSSQSQSDNRNPLQPLHQLQYGEPSQEHLDPSLPLEEQIEALDQDILIKKQLMNQNLDHTSLQDEIHQLEHTLDQLMLKWVEG